MAEMSDVAIISDSDNQPTTRDIVERKKTSGIWAFFTVDTTEKTCHICNTHVSRGGSVPKTFNTSNLRKHLKGHPEKYKEFLEFEQEKSKETNDTRGCYRQA